MKESYNNKKLATLICIIFATHLVALVYGMYAGAIMYRLPPVIFNVGNMILDLPIIISAYIIASQKDLYATSTAKLFSWIFFGLQSFGLLNFLSYVVFDNNLSGLMGSSAHIIFPIVYAASTVLFYATLRMWNPVKIVGILSTLPSIINGIFLFQVVGKDYSEDLLPIFNAIGTTSWVNMGLYAAALILSIIWALKRPVVPSMRSQTIDAI